MNDQVNKEHQVKNFLNEFKQIVTSGRGLDIVPRAINMDAMIELGITKEILRDTILALQVTNYSAGPEPDRDRPGEVWIFGTQIDETEIYIKLKIAEIKTLDIGTLRIAKCISFHKCDEALSYPLRKAS